MIRRNFCRLSGLSLCRVRSSIVAETSDAERNKWIFSQWKKSVMKELLRELESKTKGVVYFMQTTPLYNNVQFV